MIHLYMLVAALWGIFAMCMHGKIHPRSSILKLSVVGLLNGHFWFITMPIAIYQLASGNHDKYFNLEETKNEQ